MITPEQQLCIMALTGLAGAVISASVEEHEIHEHNLNNERVELPHGLLMAIRAGVATMIAVMMVGWVWRAVTLVTFAGALFAPAHRTLLNYLRITRHPQENKTITMTHLRNKGYDALLGFIIPNERPRFITLCCLELLAAAVLYQQAHVQ